ncbi:hypothetical protein [Streptomyces sp. NPDC005078]|uniref:hypothetical protein n=1 Tax=Streptomyces sp. NPDC005078 TaxID=3154293 RepID=UPI0033B212F0
MSDVVLGEALECVHASEPNRCRIAAELVGSGGVQLCDPTLGGVVCGHCVNRFSVDLLVLAQPLATQADEESGSTTSAGSDSERGLDRVETGLGFGFTAQAVCLSQ